MPHIQPDVMQRFLSDEVDLMEREGVMEHLAHCNACATLLTQLTLEDDSLGDALALDGAEAAWVAETDLTGSVLQRIRPWYREPAFIALLLATAATGVWTTGRVAEMLAARMAFRGPVDLVFGLLQALVPALRGVARYIVRGGILTTIWPVLVLAAAVALWRLRTRKEESENA